MKKDLYCVLLAGGSGTRFWPLSRQVRPKQFLKIVGAQSLFEQTLSRIRSQVPARNILVVTSRRYKTLVRRQAKAFRIPAANFLYEPEGKNTAPAIAWAASRIYSKDRDAVMAVLPSDHLIANPSVFLGCLKEAVGLARQNFLVTFGIVPTRPETGYGYLRTKAIRWEGKRVLTVEQFIEKPPLDKAKVYARSRNFFWNSGMFVWKASVIREELKFYLPEIFLFFIHRNDQAYAQKIWKDLPGISIDYGVLEKSRRVAAVPAAGIGWSDVGSWEALLTVLPKDGKGNSLEGNVVPIDCAKTLVKGGKKLIALVGLEGIAVVDTPDALLVGRLDQSQKLRDVIAALKAKKRKEI